MNQRANQLAHYLIAQGVKPEDKVGIAVERSIEMVVGPVLAVVKTGAVYVPIDLTHPQDRLAYIIQDSGMNRLLTMQSASDLFVRLDNIQTYALDTLDLSPYPVMTPDVSFSQDSLVYIIYTSGSTGKPKGTMITHKGLSNYLAYAAVSYMREGEVKGSVVSSSLTFDATVTSLFTPLLSGKSVRLLSDGDELNQLAQLMEAATEPLLFKITPAHLDGLNEVFTNQHELTVEHMFVVGGDKLMSQSSYHNQ